MADQTQRLEIATVRAEVGSNIMYRFANDAVDAGGIPTDSGNIPNLRQVIAEIQEDGAEKISIATTIYQSPAAGLAGTADGGIYLVQSADADTIYTVWKNDGGSAVNTGKTAMSSQAIENALTASNEAAQAAEDAADVATTRTAGFLQPSAEAPTIRDDGLPLQVGDRYFNTETETEYLFKEGGWTANDSLAAIAELEASISEQPAPNNTPKAGDDGKINFGWIPDQVATAEAVGELRADIVGQRDKFAQDAAVNASMFAREKLIEVGFRDVTYDQLLTTYNYTYLYPQQLAIDEAASELWIIRRSAGGSNTWAWVWVYDIDTLSIKTVFSTGENWKESLVLRRVGATRYLYTVGNNNDVIRFDITTLPANLSVATASKRYAVSAYSQIAFDGRHWFVQDVSLAQGLARRNMFKVYDSELSAITGKLVLPLDCVGTIQDYIDSFPHMQAVCMHKGAFYVSVGGAYVPASNSADSDKPYYLQGLHAFSPSGDVLASALCQPDGFIVSMSQVCGYPATIAENEGVASSGEDLYSLWITLGPSERVSPDYAGKGIVITKELSKGDGRVDFSSASTSCKTVLDLDHFSNTVWSSASQLTNPVTGQALNSFASVIAMMQQLGISKYSYGGTAQTLTDLNAAAITITGKLVVFETANGSTFFVSIVDTSGNVIRYGLTGSTQLGPFNNGGEFGSNANGYYFKHSNGELTCILTNSVGLTCTVARGAIFSSDAYTWTYPLPFVGDRPIVTVNACYGLRWGGATALPGYDTCAVVLFATAADATARTFQLMAKGRWK